jgi:C4-dicarboxylate-specific signal transduction histidine kinase
MRARIASIAFLLGSVSTGVTWLTLQPALMRLLAALHRLAAPGSTDVELLGQVRGLLPFYLALDLLAVTGLCFLVLHLAVGRPLRRAEESIEQLSRFEVKSPLATSGGPLLSRLQTALRRMAESLRDEQSLTRRQLAELEATNQRLSKARTELVAAERLAMVGKLAAGVAHEVGNPLAGILGYLSLARSRASSPELIEMLQRIDAEVQRIDQIVRGLLELGRPAQGRSMPVDVGTLAANCVKLLSAGPDFGQVEVALAIDPGTLALAESGPLSQVLINLLLNSAQAMEGKGSISVRARREEGRVAIEVQDSGPGISEEARPRLFEPFFTTRAAGKGSGLGLAVSRHLLAAMDGTLEGSNAEQGGARFRVSLPASPQ